MELLQKLAKFKGHHTSMVSLAITGKQQPSSVIGRLNRELATASNIKNRVNRQSVQDALKSAVQTLKTYRSFPSTGIALYAGWYV